MKQTIAGKIANLRTYYNTGATRSVDFRIQQLKHFKQVVVAHEEEIEQALWSDLHKSSEESFLTEYSIIVQEIDFHIRHLRSWARPQRVKTPLHLFPSRSYVHNEPLGLALIVAPWNYPFQLIMNPLIGAISAGCVAMLKPSPMAPATAAIVQKIVAEAFTTDYVDLVQGNREVNTLLFEHKYDFIFFTGSPFLGRIVHQAAAQHLTPVILELGGKSPCIVDSTADIALAARRIAWGKWLNAGQTCVAPDYLYVQDSIKEQLLVAIKAEITRLYGVNPQESPYYPRIVNAAALDRLTSLMEHEHIYCGGQVDKQQRYIAPTILTDITPDAPVMQGEIFGPILPVMIFTELGEALQYINAHEKPLALYYFGRHGKHVIHHTTSGGVCINDTVMHVSNHHLPFGGVGMSGMGKYHAKESYAIFSNQRAVLSTATWLDLPFKYPPFRLFKWVRKFILR